LSKGSKGSKGYYLVALGCDKNIIDAEVMAERLRRGGFHPSEFPDEADVLIVHTCGFVESAKEESIDTILGLENEKGDGAKLVVSGCLAQRYPDELAKEIEEIDLVLGVGKHADIIEHLSGQRISVSSPEDWDIDTIDRLSSTPQHYAFLKVSEGCNNRCSFCVIPSIRGGHRSRSIKSIVAESRRFGERGLVELNLVAQDVASYGVDFPDGTGLTDLLKSLLRETDIPWIRLLYLHPKNITNGLIDLVSSEERILSYLDVPIQHCSDAILKSMGRGIGKEGIINLINEMRSKIENLYIRTSLIVGYPGEGEREFNELCEFVKNVRFQNLGVFRYSKEEGTRAFDMKEHPPEDIVEDRYDTLMEIQREMSLGENEKLVGKVIKVLVDGDVGDSNGDNDKVLMRGRFYGQAPEVDGEILINGEGLLPGDVVDVVITDAEDYDLIGDVLDKKT
jgi:ribosomal protein S12 methylthiotransferase